MKSIFPSVLKAYKIHIIAWATFILYEILLTTVTMGYFPPHLAVYECLNVLLFYVHAELYFRLSNKYILIPFLIIAEVIGFCVIMYLIETSMRYMGLLANNNEISLNLVYLSRSIWRALYFIGFSTGFVYILKALEESKLTAKLKTENLVNTLNNERLENELVKVENNFLRSQINPHFLFNTLSFIYNGTRKTAPEAASAILSLSDMMRYALKQPNSSDTIYIIEEIEQVENLINLHKLRTKDGIFIELHKVGDLSAVKFLPLMLLTLVENVFKHGNLTNPNHPAKITVSYVDNVFEISTQNLIAETHHGESNSVGMENIRKRLEGYYKGKAKLLFEKVNSNYFKSSITVEP